MKKLFNRVRYEYSLEDGSCFNFFHEHNENQGVCYMHKGRCIRCRKFIAPYKKLELMVKLKEFTEGR